jgi:hypothetical protein
MVFLTNCDQSNVLYLNLQKSSAWNISTDVQSTVAINYWWYKAKLMYYQICCINHVVAVDIILTRYVLIVHNMC